MDEPERLALLALRVVCGVQALERAGHDAHGVARRNALSALARLAHEARERLARDVLHDEKELAVVGHDIEGGDDVGVADARRERASSRNIATKSGILREVRMEPLDGDGASKADGAEQARKMDGGHAAGGDLAVQRVPTQTSAVIRAGLLRHLQETVSSLARP